jgi:hypothetical protein
LFKAYYNEHDLSLSNKLTVVPRESLPFRQPFPIAVYTQYQPFPIAVYTQYHQPLNRIHSEAKKYPINCSFQFEAN